MRKQIIEIDGLEILVASNNLIEGGKYPKNCYLPADEEGFHGLDTIKYQAYLNSIEAKNLREAKDKQLAELQITANTVPFDANDQSINYMSSVLGLGLFKAMDAQYKISKDLIDETSPRYIGTAHAMFGYCTLVVSTYETVFKTKIAWKNADNTISNVQLETVCEALEKAMREVGEIKTK
jgi:hypothetical protein